MARCHWLRRIRDDTHDAAITLVQWRGFGVKAVIFGTPFTHTNPCQRAVRPTAEKDVTSVTQDAILVLKRGQRIAD